VGWIVRPRGEEAIYHIEKEYTPSGQKVHQTRIALSRSGQDDMSRCPVRANRSSIEDLIPPSRAPVVTKKVYRPEKWTAPKVCYPKGKKPGVDGSFSMLRPNMPLLFMVWHPSCFLSTESERDSG